MKRDDETFELWDLRVEVVAVEGRSMVCNHPEGSWFELRGEELHLPAGQSFPIYPLAAVLPLLPAKQRDTDPNDWMSTDADVVCPDPHCGAVLRIRRIRRRTFRRSDVTAVPLPTADASPDADSGKRTAEAEATAAPSPVIDPDDAPPWD
ncbi:MAG: TIGR04076 family protein [Acidobacteriota bacterium]